MIPDSIVDTSGFHEGCTHATAEGLPHRVVRNEGTRSGVFVEVGARLVELIHFVNYF